MRYWQRSSRNYCESWFTDSFLAPLMQSIPVSRAVCRHKGFWIPLSFVPSGFIAVMAQLGIMLPFWEPLHTQSFPCIWHPLRPGHRNGWIALSPFLVSLCYGLFAYTYVIGCIIFSEIAGKTVMFQKKASSILSVSGALVSIPWCAFRTGGLELITCGIFDLKSNYCVL